MRLTHLIVVLGLDARHELEELLLKVVVVFHPAQLAKGVKMAVDDLGNVLVVCLFFVVIDVHHAEGRALLLDCDSFVRAGIRDILYLHQELVSSWYELVDLDRNARHVVPAAGHVDGELDVAPLMNELRDKVLEVRVFMHLRDQSRQKVVGQLDELDADTSQSTIGIRALRAFQAPFADVARTTFVSLKHTVPAGCNLSHVMGCFGDLWLEMGSERSATVLAQILRSGRSRRFGLRRGIEGHLRNIPDRCVVHLHRRVWHW